VKLKIYASIALCHQLRRYDEKKDKLVSSFFLEVYDNNETLQVLLIEGTEDTEILDLSGSETRKAVGLWAPKESK
jgi:hypothetical protein